MEVNRVGRREESKDGGQGRRRDRSTHTCEVMIDLKRSIVSRVPNNLYRSKSGLPIMGHHLVFLRGQMYRIL